MFSSFSKLRVDLFGESHAKEIGVVIEGIPAGTPIDFEGIQSFLDRRKSGKGAHSTPRVETDRAEFVSGVKKGVTDGSPIKAVIQNISVKSGDYDHLKFAPRPSHSDYVSYVKFGHISAGGGRFSGRLTAPLCIAGGIAKQILKEKGVEVAAYVGEIGGIFADSYKNRTITLEEIKSVSGLPLPVISEEARKEIADEIFNARSSGDSLGGTVECIVFGLPAGWGNALFEGLEGRLASAVFAVPAVKGIEFGSGFDLVRMKGSKANDQFAVSCGKVITETNHSGGINGGISNGMPLTMRVAFRPTPSIGLKQNSVNLQTMESQTIEIKGRHDACIVPRAVPCVEAAAALVILDAYLDSLDK